MAQINDNEAKLARIYDSFTDTWYPLVGQIPPHTHDAFSLDPNTSVDIPLDRLSDISVNNLQPNDLLFYDDTIFSGNGGWVNKPIDDIVNDLDLVTYLKVDVAFDTYLSKSDASTTYLTQSSASSTYLTQTNASNTYLTQSNAATTYVPRYHTPITASNSTYSMNLSDDSKTVFLSNSNEIIVSVPSDATNNFPIGAKINFVQALDGPLRFSPEGAVSLVSRSSFRRITSRWGHATLMKRGSDSWILYGDLTS
jgi:hypothetical protein